MLYFEELSAFMLIIATAKMHLRLSCTHTHEPSCAVKEEVENGQIWQVRYDNYLQFLSEIENRRETYKKTVKRK